MSTTTGPGRPRAGDVERLVDRARDLQRVLDHEAVLDGRHRDADDVGLLEAVGAEQLGAHLAGDEHRRDRVHHRVHDRRDEVRRARARRAEGDADLAGRLRVALARRGRRRPRGGRGRGGSRRRRARRRSGGSRRPGRPNTTSTPSAFRHSITASTARMCFRCSCCSRGGTRPRAAGRKSRVYQRSCGPQRAGSAARGLVELGALGELELGAAAGAQGLVERARPCPHRGTGGAAPRLVAVQDRGQQPDEGRDRGDEEPEEERAALQPSDDARRPGRSTPR